ncbi:fascin-like [Carcharodon carcharias]|uniref:fascin-like n=1 Tax=Carcharodon carcharias TaxID=13397 RepID=UPI001B7DAB14|nr:fascin-like [Carcharodon carcharias]
MVYRVLPVGLINSAQKYLTAENFNFRVNATSTILKIKQIWTIEFLKENSPMVHIRSSLRRYLAGDNNGKITCDREVPNPYNKFVMITHPNGKVSFQSEETKRYLGGAEDNITCFAQAISESEKWVLHLAIHPNVSMFNKGKKKYLRYDTSENAVQCDSELPWGQDCVMTLMFNFKEKKYSIRTSSGDLIAWNGKLEPCQSSQTLYIPEIRCGMICLKDNEGRFLTGRDSYIRTIKTDRPSLDEFFSPDPSPGQVTIRSILNSKYVSLKPGADVCVHQSHVTDSEIFQIIINNTTRKACFRGISKDYLAVGPQNIIVASPILTDDCWFNIVYNGPKVVIKTGDGKLLTTKSTGQLMVGYYTADNSQEFILKLTNRPLLILQSDFGFVAFCSGTQRLDGNRPMYEVNRMTSDEDGYYQFKLVSTDKYWEMDKDGFISGTGEQPINFIIQLVGSNVLILKAPNGKYMITQQSGDFKATGEDAKTATMFLY